MMRKILIAALFAVGLAISSQAYALTLDQARGQGLVGEKLDGYVATVKASSDAQALVNEVNTRRRAEYEKISKQNGQPVAVVSKIAAEKIISNLPKGSFYQSPSGGWTQK